MQCVTENRGVKLLAIIKTLGTRPSLELLRTVMFTEAV